MKLNRIAAVGLTLLATAGIASQAAECRANVLARNPCLAGKIDPLVDAAVEQGFAGGVALILDGTLVYSRSAGFSDRRKRVPVTDETVFHVASISKYLTATLVMRAVEEGRLSIDDPLEKFLPGTRLGARGVTIGDLLAHRSGLGSSYVAERTNEAGAAVEAIDAVPIDLERAGSFRYSNDGYDLLAVVLERVYDSTYEQIANDLVFEPACLKGFGFWGTTELTDATVVGQPLRTPSRKLRRRNYGMIGSAGWLITARDLARFEAVLAGDRLLSEASRRALTAPRGKMSSGEATFGAFLVEHPEFGRVLSARGYEDWGDNAILNHYVDHALILAVVTSKGPAEGENVRPFRDTLSKAIEDALGGSGLALRHEHQPSSR